VCECVDAHVCMYVRMYVRERERVCVGAHVRMYVCKREREYVWVHMYVCM